MDAGCGPGPYLAELVAHGAEAIGFDQSADMVRHARNRLGPGTRDAALLLAPTTPKYATLSREPGFIAFRLAKTALPSPDAAPDRRTI